jgi:RNA polymerase sigma factor (TIGR02999 family)
MAWAGIASDDQILTDFLRLQGADLRQSGKPEAGSEETMSASPQDDGYFPLVYDELRRLAAAKLAREPAGHSLDATALVHEAYLRLGGGAFANRSGFLRVAAVAMQRILVDHARRKRAARRGGAARQFSLDEADRVVVFDPDTLLDIEAALTRLSVEDAVSADVARFRLFAGLSIDEASLALGLSRATAFREWAYARSWLTAALAAREPDNTKAGPGEP